MKWNRAWATGNHQQTLIGWMAMMLMGLGIAPLHGATPSRPADPQAAQADDTVRVGAEFFLNRSETADSVAGHFRMMKEQGLTVARIFVIWDDIERRPGQWDFRRYDWVYDAAAANGIRIAATLCAEDPPGWTQQTSFYHQRTDLNDPQRRKHAAEYLEKVVLRYRNHPAQGYWLLMNEPTLPQYFTPPTMARFGQWLQQRYGTVDQLNLRWFRPLKSFAEVQLDPAQWNTGWKDYSSYVDWKEFNIDNLCDQLRWIGARVRELDPHHPTHANPHGLLGTLPATGQDLWREAKTVDFLGASMHPPWHFNDFRRPDFGVAYACCVDQLRSVSHGHPWWVTELQGGPTVFTGKRAMTPTGQELTRWLWDAVGGGAKGIVFWLWNPRTLGREGGEWALLGLDGRPTERLLAVKDFARVLATLPVVGRAVPQKSRVAILYSEPTLLLCDLEGQNVGHEKDALLSLWGCYRALLESHVPVDFINVEELKAGRAANYDVLYLPHCYALDAQTGAAVRRFAEAGGAVWADGLLGWKDPYGDMASKAPMEMTELFGFELHDIESIEQPFPLTGPADLGGELWRVHLTLQGADVMLRDGKDKPVATSHRFGKGIAYYYATALSRGYFRRPQAEVRRWITAPAVARNTALPVEMENVSEGVVFRGMVAPSQRIAILGNWGPKSTSTVCFEGDFHCVVETLTGSALKPRRERGRTIVDVSLENGSVAVVIAE
jgi:beta-galactosidase